MVGDAGAIERKGLGVVLSGGILMCVVGVAETTFSVLDSIAMKSIGSGVWRLINHTRNGC